MNLNLQCKKGKGRIILKDEKENQTYSLKELFQFIGEAQTKLYEGVHISMSPATLEHEGVMANLIGEIGSVLEGNTC